MSLCYHSDILFLTEGQNKKVLIENSSRCSAPTCVYILKHNRASSTSGIGVWGFVWVDHESIVPTYIAVLDDCAYEDKQTFLNILNEVYKGRIACSNNLFMELALEAVFRNSRLSLDQQKSIEEIYLEALKTQHSIDKIHDVIL